MAAHKFTVLVSVLAVALMLGTCFLPVTNTGIDSEATAAIDDAVASVATEEEESYDLEDILTYLSKLDLQELITSLGLPDFDIPFELLPNMTMEEFFIAVKQIMSGEKTLRQVLEEAGVSYNEQIAEYVRGVMKNVLEKAGEAFTAIIKNSMASTEPKLEKEISNPTYCYKGQEYRFTGGSEITFSDTGKLTFVEGSKMVIDGNFEIICDKSLTSGQQIVLKPGSIIDICGYQHTVMSEITIEMAGTIKSVFYVDFTMGSVNMADFEISVGLGNNGYVKFNRLNTFFQFDSCRDGEYEFSIKLHAELTDTLLNALNIADGEAAVKDLSNVKNKIELDITMFDLVGVTDLVSEMNINIDYNGQGNNLDKDALKLNVGLELSEDEVVLFSGSVTANITQADLLTEMEAFNEKTSKMLPFKGSILIDMDLGQRAIFNEYGIDVCKLDIHANYSVTIGENDILIDMNVQRASFELGISSFRLDDSGESKIPTIVSVEMPLLKVKLTTDRFGISYPFSLLEENDLNIMDKIVPGSYVDGILYVGERDDPDINWRFDKYEGSDYKMEFDGTVDVPAKELKVLMLNTDAGEPKLMVDLDHLIIETVNGEYAQSGTADIEIFLALESADVEKETKINTLEIDIDCSIDFENLTGSGYVRVDGIFGSVNQVMGTGIFENSSAMELIVSTRFGNLDIEFTGDDKYTVNGDIRTLFDFHSTEGDEDINIFRHVFKYTTDKKQERSLRSFDFKGAYSVTEEMWALEDPEVPSVSETIKGTIGHQVDRHVTENDLSSIESYYLDRLFKVGFNNEGQIEASIRDGNEPLKVVIDNGIKSVTGIADISFVYGDPKSDVSVGRMNVDVGFSELFETSILEAVQRMGFKISALDIHDAVDEKTYMTILVPELLIEMTDAVSNPVYEIKGSASSDIQLNKIHLKSSVDIPNGIYSKSRTLKVDDEEITVRDVTGEAKVIADAEITGGTPGQDGYYHVSIDGLDANLVLDGTLYTSSRAELFALMTSGSLVSCNSFIYTTKFQETTDILVEDMYLKYSENGNCLMLELGNDKSNRATNRMKVTTSNFKIADKKVKYLEFEVIDNYSTIYITQEDLASMYSDGNIKLEGFSVGTKLDVKDARVSMSLGRGDNIEMRASDVDMKYVTDDDIDFNASVAVSSTDFALDYAGNENVTYITLTKIEMKAFCSGQLNITDIQSKGILIKDMSVSAGSSALSESNYDSNPGMDLNVIIMNGNNMIKVTSSGLKLKADINGYFSNVKSIIMWDMFAAIKAQEIQVGLLIEMSEMAFIGSNVTIDLTNNPKTFTTDVSFTTTHVKVDYKFANNEYDEDLRQMILEVTNSSGDAHMTDFEYERVSLNVRSEYTTLTLTDLAEVYARNMDLRTKETLKEFDLAAGQYTFISAVMVFPIRVSGDSTIAFEGTSHFAIMMFDNPANVSGSFYIGGEIPKKYAERFVLTGGDDINLDIDNDYVLYVKDLKSSDIEVAPLKGHSVAEYDEGVTYTISEEGNAVLTSFLGIVDINCVPNKYKLSVDGEEAEDITYGETVELLKPMKLNSGYVFAGWNDGETTYPASARLDYEMPARDVNMRTVWAKSIQYKDRNSCTSEISVTFSPSEFSKKLKDDTEQVSIAMRDLTVSMDKTFLSEISPDNNLVINAIVATDVEDDLKERIGEGICIDITVSNGAEITNFEEGQFFITVAIPSEWDSRTIKAYCIDTTHNEPMDVVKVFTKNGVQYATFAVMHFSQYVVDNTGEIQVSNGDSDDNGGNGETSGASGSNNMMLYIGIGAAALVVLLGVVILLVKRH